MPKAKGHWNTLNLVLCTLYLALGLLLYPLPSTEQQQGIGFLFFSVQCSMFAAHCMQHVRAEG